MSPRHDIVVSMGLWARPAAIQNLTVVKAANCLLAAATMTACHCCINLFFKQQNLKTKDELGEMAAFGQVLCLVAWFTIQIGFVRKWSPYPPNWFHFDVFFWGGEGVCIYIYIFCIYIYMYIYIRWNTHTHTYIYIYITAHHQTNSDWLLVISGDKHPTRMWMERVLDPWWSLGRRPPVLSVRE